MARFQSCSVGIIFLLLVIYFHSLPRSFETEVNRREHNHTDYVISGKALQFDFIQKHKNPPNQTKVNIQKAPKIMAFHRVRIISIYLSISFLLLCCSFATSQSSPKCLGAFDIYFILDKYVNSFTFLYSQKVYFNSLTALNETYIKLRKQNDDHQSDENFCTKLGKSRPQQ